MSGGTRREWRIPLAVAALAAGVALSSLPNQFVYDDVPIIVQNSLVHDLASSPAIWSSRYWPVGQLYRPLTIQLFNFQWALGGGRPVAFHAMSILLYALLAVLVYRLARRVMAAPAAHRQLPDSPAPWLPALAAGLFAVHPVHVEPVANVVGQSELLAALFTLLAVERFIAWRTEDALSASRRMALAGLTLLAIFSKETGYVIPLLLGAAELCLFRAPRRAAVSVIALQGGAVVAALLIRLEVLGSLSGETPAAAIRGLGFWDRATGMLAVVPEWARLLVWPARLQGEYGPPAVSVIGAPAGVKLLGVAILLVSAVLFAWGWRRERAVAFGVAWIAVALVPVSNVLAATGLLLAERTLFLPSVGAMLVAAAVAVLFASRLAAAPRGVRLVAAAAGIALIIVAAARSAERATVWSTQSVFFARLVEDAPRTYRAHYVASRFYYGEKRYPEAEREARVALALYRRDAHVHEHLGQVLRTVGRCGEAVPVLAEGVRLSPRETTVRSRLIECMLATGDTTGARAVAAEAVKAGLTEFAATLRRLSPASPSRSP